MDDALTTRLAERLRRLRQERGLSLDQLAERSKVSRATLSRLENAEVSPTAEVLGKLCAAYALTMSRLMWMVEEEFTARIPRDKQALWTDAATGFARRLVSPPAKALAAEVVECALRPGTSIVYDAPPAPGLEHHLILLEGCLMVSLDERTYRLEAGDCLRYQLVGVSAFRTAPDTAAKYLLVLV